MQILIVASVSSRPAEACAINTSLWCENDIGMRRRLAIRCRATRNAGPDSCDYMTLNALESERHIHYV